jgi:hypothetical protein
MSTSKIPWTRKPKGLRNFRKIKLAFQELLQIQNREHSIQNAYLQQGFLPKDLQDVGEVVRRETFS